MIVHILENSL